ncbi:MAG: hypothetical protein DWQ10_06985 [Calditrichaeota bacterium]|nr:MAG: hypothetical protein DWQ10_06985 [Calditrichota bacterium]
MTVCQRPALYTHNTMREGPCRRYFTNEDTGKSSVKVKTHAACANAKNDTTTVEKKMDCRIGNPSIDKM